MKAERLKFGVQAVSGTHSTDGQVSGLHESVEQSQLDHKLCKEQEYYDNNSKQRCEAMQS